MTPASITRCPRLAWAADVAEPGTALVPGRLLAEITRSLPGQPAQVQPGRRYGRPGRGSAEFSLGSAAVAGLPGAAQACDPAGTVDSGSLAAASQVVPSASRDDTLPMLDPGLHRYRRTGHDAGCHRPVPDGAPAVVLDPGRPGHPGVRAGARQDAGRRRPDHGAGRAGTASPRAEAEAGLSRDGQDEAAAGAGPRPADGMISFEGGGRLLTARLIARDFIKYRSRFPSVFGSQAEVPAPRRSSRRSGGCPWSPSAPARCGCRSASARS